MTEPSPAAKKLACELANAQGGNWQPRHVAPNSSIYALALRLDFEDKVARDAVALIENCEPFVAVDNLRSLMLPDEPDPLEEALRATWPGFEPPPIEGWTNQFRAELAKRGLTIAEEK